jgi:hypothetical protein
MAFKKGHIGWMKNKKHPDETKRKISESLKKAYKEGKHIYSTKGKHLSEETRKKMSFSRSKEKHPLWGKHHSEESKQKMRLKKLGLYAGEKHYFYGKHHTDETKRKIRESTLGTKHHSFGKHFSAEHRQRQSISALKNWQNEEIAKKRIESFGLKPNGMELYLDSILQNHFPDEWKFVGDGQVIIGGLCPDFINVNGKKKIIELFGHFWHEGKIISKGGVLEHRTEEGKKKVYGEIGYDTLVIWDDELDNESKVIEKINRFLFDTR